MPLFKNVLNYTIMDNFLCLYHLQAILRNLQVIPVLFTIVCLFQLNVPQFRFQLSHVVRLYKEQVFSYSINHLLPIKLYVLLIDIFNFGNITTLCAHS